jgi:hypothetical protein
MLHEVEIGRIHKGSPYNCAAVIPKIECENREEVINLPEVQELMGKTFGRRLRVYVNTIEPYMGDFLEYEFVKTRAITFKN